MRRQITTALCVLLFSLSGCWGCLGGTATVRGRVFDASGPLEGVTVRGGSKTVTTDAAGLFTVKVRRGGDLLTFEREGHAPAYRPVAPGGAEWITVVVEMVPQERFTVEDPTKAATITAGAFDEVTVAIPAEAVKTSDPYDVAVAYYPVLSGQQTPPVPFLGKEKREILPLESWGMVEVSLLCGDKPCKLRKDATITVRLPTAAGAPQTATLFTADPDEGIWIPDGEVENDGAFWTLPLTHLSWKNVDVFYEVPDEERACVRLKAVSASGRPLPGARLSASWGDADRRTITGTTESDGALCEASFPSNTSIQVVATHFLRPDGATFITSSLHFTPSAIGASCEEEACETLTLTLACINDAECGDAYRCVSGECVERRPPGPVKVTLRNEDALENIHIWGPEEGIDAANRLTPESKRRETFEAAPGDSLLFHAGRNSVTLATLACFVVSVPNREAEVIWDGTFLRCEGF